MRDQINVYFRDFRKNPLTFSKVVYTFPNADAELRLRCFQKMEEKYGKNPPKQISDRLEQELRTSRVMPRRIYFSLDCACSKEEMSNSTLLFDNRIFLNLSKVSFSFPAEDLKSKISCGDLFCI